MDAGARRAGALREIALLGVSEAGASLTQFQRYMDDLHHHLEAAALPEDVRIVHATVVGEPVETIVAATRRGISLAGVAPGALDLVIMGTHGRGGLGRWTYGSVASSVLARAERPVLLVPPANEPRYGKD
jgi:nucleotide-binding universal stress UspA family protein